MTLRPVQLLLPLPHLSSLTKPGVILLFHYTLICSSVKNKPHAFLSLFSASALERRLVPWIADSEVKFCPFCKRQFNLARRRHHCRLCGGIMCGKCSVFVGVPFSGEYQSHLLHLQPFLEFH